MSRTSRGGIDSVERTLAPHVEAEWAEAFLVELRLIGVDGADIGAALAEVESHVAEAGETAAAIFGEPVAYARALGLKPGVRQTRTAIVKAVLPVVVQVAGMGVVLGAASASARAEALTLGVNLLLPVALVALAFIATPMLRVAINHGLLFGLAVAAIALVLGLGSAVLGSYGLSVPAIVGWVVGLACLGAGTGWSIRQSTRGDVADPIVGPLVQPGRRRGRSGAWWLIAWQVPVATVVLVAVVLMWLH
jgi:hypothetical protein